MALLRLPSGARTTRRTGHPLALAPRCIRLTWLLMFALLGAFALPAAPAHAAPELWLPTPAGEHWRILQGYACGSHNSWDRYSLDLVNTDGPTYGAPVRAAADGTVFVWAGGSGTLILDHGGGFYTMYTHLGSTVTTRRGHFFARGTVLGTVGDRGTPGLPHLHFTAFTGDGPSARGRRSVPLSFADGYDLPEVGGCSQHGGTVLTGGESAIASAPGLAFNGAEPGRWYNGDVRIEFGGTAAAQGFSQAWNRDPGGDAPTFADAHSGYMQLSWAGEGLHTLYIRAWGADGQPIVQSFGPIGYDLTPPVMVSSTEMTAFEVAAGQPALLRWSAARDSGSGIAGYRVYLGTDPAGTSEWFVQSPEITSGALGAGSYLLRVQPLDYAGNMGEWATVGRVISQ